ncbi:DUF3592 domain-containing protein [Agreia sp. VKM Ac-1783]|uniref:DUF3592 domain-containing protein n=1 Tax=Agreia sp. VKM Ac-1783 TaxID=1938889 RepID=UPI000A2AEED6|nr:DUF3592 domain-containing protein [Agreia sp. VKM Ac-1783]SMQ70965.1 hypothetical protein SAMN06295943_2091 [Agreia sp. VKM Ac-1783]
MSTVDPSLARIQRTPRRPSLGRVIFLLVVLLGGGFGLGYGWGGFGLFDGMGEPPWQSIVGAIVGLMITILGSIGWSWTVMRRADVGIGYGLAAWFIGGGTGLFIVAQPSGSPALAGMIAAVLLALGVLFLVLGLVAAISRRRQISRDERTMRTGTLTAATVRNKGYDFFRESPRILTTVTFTFVDLQGTQRWVQRTMVIEQSDPVVDGQQTRLWYDAANPGDARGIVVELARERQMRH